MIDVDLYLTAAHLRSAAPPVPGGQHLLRAEIVGCFAGCRNVWLPFAQTQQLEAALRWCGFRTARDDVFDTFDTPDAAAGDCDAMYFGTPTIVGGCVLFPECLGRHALLPYDEYRASWNRDSERRAVRALMETARQRGMSVVVSGLGSGDVSLYDRVCDMGEGTKVAAVKHFCTADEQFSDYVLVQHL